MHRSARLIVAVVALLAVAGGTALAARQATNHGPRAPLAASPEGSPAGAEADGTLTAEAAAALVERLAGAGLETDVATLTALAAEHGVGGAVRLLGWAQQTGRSLDEIAAMRADGMGWGRIARDLDVHPGIGKWMRGAHDGGDDAADEAGALGDAPHGVPDRGRGTGRAHAPGQANRP